MNSAFKYVVAMLAGLLFFVSVKAQTPLEEELLSYEKICRMCLSLRTRINTGEQVSRDEAETTIDLFVAMNRKLKVLENDMTVLQRQRFRDIGEWFTTGIRPERPSLLPTIVCAAQPVLMSCASENLLAGPGQMFRESVMAGDDSPSCRYFALAELAAPDFSYGLRIGAIGRRFGGYAAYRSNFTSANPSYECTSDGRLPNGAMIWASGTERTGNMAITAGFIAATCRWMAAYAGAGYGWRCLQWQDIDGNWAEVSDFSFRGLAVEVGLLFSYRRMAFSAGLSTISFKTASFTIGVGLQL